MGLSNKKNHISPGQDSVSIGKDKGMKMNMLEDKAESNDYLDDEEVWVQLGFILTPVSLERVLNT